MPMLGRRGHRLVYIVGPGACCARYMLLELKVLKLFLPGGSALMQDVDCPRLSS